MKKKRKREEKENVWMLPVLCNHGNSSLKTQHHQTPTAAGTDTLSAAYLALLITQAVHVGSPARPGPAQHNILLH